jgi:phosphatidylserine decarboxylase
MKYIDRNGNMIHQNDKQDKILEVLYTRKAGRILLRQLIKPWVSNTIGAVMNNPCSTILIPSFVKKNKINMEEYESRRFTSYNDFFTRRLKEGQRMIDQQPDHLIAPCDGKLSVYTIDKNSRFLIKNTRYTLQQLLRSNKLADFYENGILLLFRLTVDDYHRYCYIDHGSKSRNYHLKGVFHTVNPIANQVLPIYKENTREFTIIDTNNFGRVLTMEVGALMVGRIVNYHEEAIVARGEEKGRFEFGGSTIIVVLEKGRAVIDEDIRSNSRNGIETLVKLGERIGTVASNELKQEDV